jgi:hypothetical protein
VTVHYREVRIPRPAALTLTELATTLEEQKFEINTRDEQAYVLIADRTTTRSWPWWLLIGVVLGLVGQPDSVRVTARVDDASEGSSILAIEAKQLYGWPAPYRHYPQVISNILVALSRRLGLPGPLG